MRQYVTHAGATPDLRLPSQPHSTATAPWPVRKTSFSCRGRTARRRVTATCCTQRWTLGVINLRRLHEVNNCDGRVVTKKQNKNSSGDEIANVNFYAVRPGNYPNSLT